jgi:hypothetical protein
MWLCWHSLQEEGWDTGVGKSSSIKPNCKILIENPLACKADWKNDSTNTNFYTLANICF